MKQIKAGYKKNGRLHHAYGVFGDREKVREELLSFLTKDLKFSIKGNPDFWQKEFNIFKIDDSRDINQAHQNLPVKYDRKVFVVYANSITKDAQNSLLKIFEEPKAETTFFVVMPSGTNLLSTLKSRMIINRSENESEDSILSAEEFLDAKIGKRLATVAKIAKDIKDEIITKSDAITFIKNLEKAIKFNWKTKKSDSSRGESLLAIEDIEKAISYANDESPSIKVILDHLALVL